MCHTQLTRECARKMCDSRSRTLVAITWSPHGAAASRGRVFTRRLVIVMPRAYGQPRPHVRLRAQGWMLVVAREQNVALIQIYEYRLLFTFLLCIFIQEVYGPCNSAHMFILAGDNG